MSDPTSGRRGGTMGGIEPLRRPTSTDDLAEFGKVDGPFATVLLPAPSDRADSQHTLDVRWRNARRELEGQWPDERLDQLDHIVGGLEHGAAAAFVIVHRADGALLVEELSTGLRGVATHVGDHPRLLEIIEHRQRTLPHIVIETDRAGASISVFDAGEPTFHTTVEGDTEHIHRSRGGGWSHRRFQQRAENTWERNADDVADVIRDLARQYEPAIIAIAGDVRAIQMLHDDLADQFGPVLVRVEAGEPDGIADEVLTALDDVHARFQVAMLDRFRDQHGLTDPDEVMAALAEGRVDTLLVAGPPASSDDTADHHAAVAAAIAAALDTSASIVVVPFTAEMTGGVAALTRW
jgi:hypothetical protein